jgi:site-specific recombinase XerD
LDTFAVFLQEAAMLTELYPRFHDRFTSLPLLGSRVDDFVVWLHAQGYPRLPIRLRVRETPRVDALLRRHGVQRLEDLTRPELLALAPRDAQDDICLSATIRSLASYLEARGVFVPLPLTRSQGLVGDYRAHLDQVRGLAQSTIEDHASTVSELLAFLRYDAGPLGLRRLTIQRINAFIATVAPRVSRESLQHTVAQVRAFLRFLVGQGEIAAGLAGAIDTPRVYRGERLPRSLPWKTVLSFLSAIDRSTPMGRRDYAMFLLITTYGLRISEIAALRLDDIEWRAGRLCVPRSKVKTPLVLPLTKEVGAAIADYLRRGRPALPYRQVFLRHRAPAGPIARTAVVEAFQKWTRHGRLPIPYQGPHCLRHSLAVHLLRQGASLKAIGDLLGHRSREATCVYLRLHDDDLRDVALEVPTEVRS